MLADAEREGAQVVGVLHHRLLEHYVGQSVLFPDYAVRHWDWVAKTLAEAGLRLVLTGHFHAQDITRRTGP